MVVGIVSPKKLYSSSLKSLGLCQQFQRRWKSGRRPSTGRTAMVKSGFLKEAADFSRAETSLDRGQKRCAKVI